MYFYEEGKKLEDDTRVKMCEDIYNKRKAIQEVMNKEDLFGEDKIVECRKIYDVIKFVYLMQYQNLVYYIKPF